MGWPDGKPSDAQLIELSQGSVLPILDLRQLCLLYSEICQSRALQPDQVQSFLGHHTPYLAARYWGLLSGKGGGEVETGKGVWSGGTSLREFLTACARDEYLSAAFKDHMGVSIKGKIPCESVEGALEQAFREWCEETAVLDPLEASAALVDYCREHLEYHEDSQKALPDFIKDLFRDYQTLAVDNPAQLSHAWWAAHVVQLCETGRGDYGLKVVQKSIAGRFEPTLRAACDPSCPVSEVLQEAEKLKVLLLEFWACARPYIPQGGKDTLEQGALLCFTYLFSKLLKHLRTREVQTDPLHLPEPSARQAGPANSLGPPLRPPPDVMVALFGSELLQTLSYGESIAEILRDYGVPETEPDMAGLVQQLTWFVEAYVKGQKSMMERACRNAFEDDKRWSVQRVEGNRVQTMAPKLVFEVLEGQLHNVMGFSERGAGFLVKGVCQAVLEQLGLTQKLLLEQPAPDYERVAAIANNSDLCYNMAQRLITIMAPLLSPPEKADTPPRECSTACQGFVTVARRAVRKLVEFMGEGDMAAFMEDLMSEDWLKGRLADFLVQAINSGLDDGRKVLRDRPFALFAAALLDRVTLCYGWALLASKDPITAQTIERLEADEAALRACFLIHFAEVGGGEDDIPWSPTRQGGPPASWVHEPSGDYSDSGDGSACLGRLARLRGLLQEGTPNGYAFACAWLHKNDQRLGLNYKSAYKLLKRREDVYQTEKPVWKKALETVAWREGIERKESGPTEVQVSSKNQVVDGGTPLRELSTDNYSVYEGPKTNLKKKKSGMFAKIKAKLKN